MNGKVTRAISERRAAKPRAVSCVARGSWLAARISHSLSRRSSGRDFRAKELTLPPTLLAARGSRLAARGSRLAARGSRLAARGSNIGLAFLAAPPAGILEQKRDCSQSSHFKKDATKLHQATRFTCTCITRLLTF